VEFPTSIALANLHVRTKMSHQAIISREITGLLKCAVRITIPLPPLEAAIRHEDYICRFYRGTGFPL